ncbi:nicolin-1-like isoform X1 [Pecten maximus]|uniref:nicolin-1-like isoform X1 n=1 Tax=Pecten maximus TaxID=6579 RepID=UPI001457EBD4|nr:nicolin-1-like isoform X1 [Pecten maximus]
MASDRPIHCNIKNPVVVNIADAKNEFHSGCKIIDITFPNVTNPESTTILSICDRVGEIHFKNSYVAYLTVRVKQKPAPSEPGSDSGTPEIKWRTCVQRMRLMSNPHCEAGSQDYYCISQKHFSFDLTQLTGMRLILQQPSPVWKDFRLEEIKLYRSSESNRPQPLPAWLIEEASNSSSKKRIEHFDSSVSYEEEADVAPLQNGGNVAGLGSVDGISASLQQLWALSEGVASNQTEKALGRFDVDGCYEINLLSYT